MPTLTLLADVAFIVVLEILDCVGQRLFEVGVFQPTFFPQSPTRRNQVSVRSAVGGIVARDVQVLIAHNPHQSNHESQNLAFQTLEIHDEVSRGIKPEGV